METEKNGKQYRVIRVTDTEHKPLNPEKPDKIERVADCEFHMFNYLDEDDGDILLNLPNFPENPEYTGDGRPFQLWISECCEYGEYYGGEHPDKFSECNDCKFFNRGNPENHIGVCMCNVRRRETNKEEIK